VHSRGGHLAECSRAVHVGPTAVRAFGGSRSTAAVDCRAIEQSQRSTNRCGRYRQHQRAALRQLLQGLAAQGRAWRVGASKQKKARRGLRSTRGLLTAQAGMQITQTALPHGATSSSPDRRCSRRHPDHAALPRAAPAASSGCAVMVCGESEQAARMAKPANSWPCGGVFAADCDSTFSTCRAGARDAGSDRCAHR